MLPSEVLMSGPNCFLDRVVVTNTSIALFIIPMSY
jgi:hypothetical protein